MTGAYTDHPGTADRRQLNVTISNDPNDLHRLETGIDWPGAERLTIRGHQAQLHQEGYGVLVRWLEAPTEAVIIAGVGIDRTDLLRVAEGLRSK